MKTIQRDIVGAFIFTIDGKLLLGNAGVYAGKLCVPGGGIDEGESKHEALVREISEETGIDLSDADFTELDKPNYGVSNKTLRDTGEEVSVEMTFYDFIVRLDVSASEVKLLLDDDFVNAAWYDASVLSELDLAEGTKTRLTQLGYIS